MILISRLLARAWHWSHWSPAPVSIAISSCTKDLNLDSQGTERALSTLVSFSVMLSRGWSRVSIDLLKFLSCCKDTSVKILTDGRMGWKCSVYFKLGILNFTSIQVLGIFKHVENDILIDIEFEYLNSVYIFQISGNPVSLFNDVHFQCDPM